MNIEDNSPVFELVEPPYCSDCGHFHFSYVACPDRNGDCGSYLCCVPSGRDGVEDSE